MRFESSQTTPPHLDRRLQLRALSFIGLVAIAVACLVALNTHTDPNQVDTQKLAASSPESLTFETRREGREIDESEFVIPDDNEPRGQWPEKSSGPRIATSQDDRGLFEPRSKEHSHDGNAKGQMFSRRTVLPTDGEPLVERDDVGSNDDPRFNRDRTENLPPVTRSERGLPPTPPEPNDDWSLPSSPSRDRSDDDVVPPRRTPSASPIFSKRNDIGSTDDVSINGSGDPFGANDSRYRNRQPAPRDNLPDGTDDFRDDIPANQIPRGNPLGRGVDSTGNVADYDVPREPVDSRRRRDLFLPPSPDDQPQYDELDSVRIDKRFLDAVKDNTVGIRRDESDVFYWLIDHARRVPTATLERAGEREIQYVNLMTEPDRFRGEPITIEGDLWRLYEFEAGSNRYGVTRVYEGWVFTGDSSNHPYRIVCTSLPKGIEPGENLRKPVRITGYFFKREGYKSNGGVHIAPTLIARRIGINPMPNGIPLMGGIFPYMIGAIMAVGLALFVTFVGLAIGDERSQRLGSQRKSYTPPMSFAGLTLAPSIPIEESLRQLAEYDRESSIHGAYGPLFSRSAAREHAVHDYATSHRMATGNADDLRRKQTGTLQTWAARQKASQAEIDAMHEANARESRAQFANIDELETDRFEPAWNVLTRPTVSEYSASSPATYSPSVPANTSISHSRVIAHPAGLAPVIPHVQKEASFSSHAQDNSTHLASHPISQSNISYSASKLSEWEEEIARMTNRGPENRYSDHVESHTSENSAAAQLERDRLERERETRERIQRERDESERLRSERLEHERLEHERQERERLNRTMHEQHNSIEDRSSFDRADRDQVTYTLEPHSEHTLSEPFESDEYESDSSTFDESVDDRASGDSSGKSSSQSGLARNRKRRRNWRDGHST